MGLFSGIFKGIKKVVKKIGKGIKSAVKSVGKFMNKIGIVGQIGLALVLPGIGTALTHLGTGMAAYTGFGSTIVNAAGSFIQGAVQVAGRVGNVFKTVGEGITKVVGQTVGTALNKMGLSDVVGKMGWDISNMTNFTGEGGIWDTISSQASKIAEAGGNLFDPLDIVTKPTLRANVAAATQSAVENMVSVSPEGVASMTTTTPEIGILNQAGLESATQSGIKGMISEATSLDFGLNQTAIEAATQTAVQNVVPDIAIPSLTGTATTAATDFSIGSLLDRGIEAGKKFVTELPENAVGYVGQGIKSGIKGATEQGVYSLAGIDTVPDVYQTSSAYVAPTLSAASIGTESYGSGLQLGGYTPAEYDMTQYPYGYNANQYNNNLYAQRMSQFVG